jgi:hypothetical protein
MLAGNAPGGTGVQMCQATINGKFVIQDTVSIPAGTAPGANKPYQEKTNRVTLLSIPGGMYEVQTSFTPGEVLPYGLAG